MKDRMKAAFLTLGCKVNYYETEQMMADFERHGFQVVDFHERADVYVINTCTVTNMADRKSRKMIHRARKNNADGVVAAVGCYVESAGKEWGKDTAADIVLLNSEKKDIARRVISYMQEHGIMQEQGRMQEYGRMSGEKAQCGEELCIQEKTASGRTRKYIKIQDGCNQFCSYCTIPYVRGGGVLSSRPAEDVLEEIRHVAQLGFQEVVITGIHLSSYGVDGSDVKSQSARQFVRLKGAPLVSLLQKVNEIRDIKRIRLGSLEPRIICREFMEGLTKVDKLCPHFHLSLQSGCDATLQRMNRHYTAAQYREGCDCIRRYYEHPAITTDVIVGFPGETEEEFETTRRFVKDVGLADIHVFPYSMRTGTKAARMDGQVPPDVKHRRGEILIADAAELKKAYTEWFVGKTEKVLFEEVREIEGHRFLVGHNERYMLFGVSAQEAQANGYHENQIAEVEIGRQNCLLEPL